MTEGYFSIKRDNELIAGGTHFWCQACVVARPLVEQSSDPRYCQRCYEVLKVEAEMQPTRRAAWMPKIVKKATRENISHKTAPEATQTTPEPEEGCDTIQQGEIVGQNRVTGDVIVKINELSAQGNSTRAIEKELAKEGVFISYRTIARILSGERML